MPEYSTINDGLYIEVDKVGGGTVGRRYEGDWQVTAKDGDTVILYDVISTGTPKSHAEVAQMAPEFIEDAADQYWQYFDAGE